MKKFKAAAIILLSVFVLAGCGGNAAPQATDGAATEAVTEAATEAVTAAAEQTEAAEEAVTEAVTAAAEQTEAAETDAAEEITEAASEAETDAAQEAAGSAPEIKGLTFDHAMPLDSAECFNVYYYKDDYKLIDVPESGQYLIIPEGKEAPEGLAEDIYKIYQPLEQVYMAATGSMSFIDQLGVIDKVTMSSLDKDGWMIEAPIKAMEEGSMVYGGKYSAPDYEMMVGRDCDLAIESTMILHSPEVQEMIEDLGIPVFIDRSSYEMDAFGRIEWIKLYAAMFNKEEVAEEKFNEQKAVLDDLKDFENTGKTVAFFAVNSNKTITVRRTEDFIPNMIELAGGKYIFDNLINTGSTSASVRLSFEEFYNTAVEADYLIYNGTIEEPLTTIDELIDKNELFAEFKAVKDGNVFCVDKTWYQSTATIGYLITDLNIMLTDGDPADMTFMKKLQ